MQLSEIWVCHSHYNIAWVSYIGEGYYGFINGQKLMLNFIFLFHIILKLAAVLGVSNTVHPQSLSKAHLWMFSNDIIF